MKKLIKVPAAGESVAQATVGEWQKKQGDVVQQNDVLVVMETDKASMDLIAEHSGRLNILKQNGSEVKIGEVIGELDTSVKAPPPSPQPAASPPPSPGVREGAAESHDVLSPAVRKLVSEHNIPVKSLQATGPGGRITKGDVLSYLKQKESPAFTVQKTALTLPSSPQEISPGRPGPVAAGEQREKMTTLRKRIAQRLVYSQQSTATLTTFNEVDMSQIAALRKRYKEEFQKKHQVKLGFMGFFIKAVVHALKTFKRVNAFIDGEDVVYNSHCHIGVAVSTDKGLVVPVIRRAEELTLPALEKAVLHYAEKAREGRITIDDLTGGTFTISNGGVFGSLMSTPILNPPQSGILGLHKIENRPIAQNGQVVIKPMMYLALSYDHRMVDGKESVSFLYAVKEFIEDPIRLLVDV